MTRMPNGQMWWILFPSVKADKGQSPYDVKGVLQNFPQNAFFVLLQDKKTTGSAGK